MPREVQILQAGGERQQQAPGPAPEPEIYQQRP